MVSTSQLNGLLDRALARARLSNGPTMIRLSGGLPGYPTQITAIPRHVIVGGLPRPPGLNTVMPEDRIYEPGDAAS